MSHSREKAPVPLELRRERVIHLLCQQVAADAMTLEEFERRVELAHRATTLAALDDVVRDLAATERAATTPAGPTNRRANDLMVAILGGVSRKGHWQPARRSRIIAFMGGVDLDFRDVALPNGTTEIFIVAIMGGAEIIVPPDLAVECSGVGILGGFEHHADLSHRAGADVPRLRITGVTLMGGVDVKVRLPGESAADARRRLREERRALRKQRRELYRPDRSRDW